EDLAKAMRRIEEEAARMGVMVDDLLLLARLDQGRPLERQPVDVTVIVADAVDDARTVDPDRSVTLEAPEAAVVLGDDARLRQVVANLLTNARQHTPPGTPVHVRVTTADGKATLEVADEGPGLSPEQAARVFERFYRAEESRTRAQGGTGLGLAIVAAISEAHGGEAYVETAPGMGARFRVELPLAPAPTDDEGMLQRNVAQ
ncbi:MAG: HAMP domain-containing histidine kinase, partial [Actinomycetota bacterium]|nr:HAMP domain-containing histidine kinase [Actinomycetota bacterium]